MKVNFGRSKHTNKGAIIRLNLYLTLSAFFKSTRMIFHIHSMSRDVARPRVSAPLSLGRGRVAPPPNRTSYHHKKLGFVYRIILSLFYLHCQGGFEGHKTLFNAF